MVLETSGFVFQACCWLRSRNSGVSLRRTWVCGPGLQSGWCVPCRSSACPARCQSRGDRVIHSCWVCSPSGPAGLPLAVRDSSPPPPPQMPVPLLWPQALLPAMPRGACPGVGSISPRSPVAPAQTQPPRDQPREPSRAPLLGFLVVQCLPTFCPLCLFTSSVSLPPAPTKSVRSQALRNSYDGFSEWGSPRSGCTGVP